MRMEEKEKHYMKKILLMSVIALSLVGASGCSNNSNSTNNSSAKSSKTEVLG